MNSLHSPEEALIVALDFPSAALALAMVDRLEGTCKWFKVGLELYLAEGRPVVETLRERGFSVFLDLKLHDIPNTVAGAVRSAKATGASLLTLHAGGGPAMLEAAVRAAEGRTKLLAVTVLTSMDTAQLRAAGIAASPAEQVLTLGTMAVDAGVDGLVCSPLEIAALRGKLGGAPLLVVPGIRLAGFAGDDQSRTASAADAMALGASKIVVGRPITGAVDPAAAALALLQEMRG